MDTLPQKDISNSELLDFIKKHVFMKSDFDDFKTKEFEVLKDELQEFRTKDFQPFKLSMETLATRVNKILDQDYPFQKKRISRVEYRTETLLGKKLAKTDAGFDTQYPGEKPVVTSPSP